MNEKKIKHSVKKVEEYLEELGIEVHYDDEISDSFCDLYWYEIHIPKNETQEFVLFSLLHEGGHFLVEAEDVFDNVITDDVDIIINEVLAWEAGLDIANSCELEIEKEKYYDTVKESIEKYVIAYRKKNP